MSSGPKPAPTTADLPGGKLSVPVPMSQVAASLRAVGGVATQPGPDTPSGDHKLMQPLWDKVSTIAGGTDAMRGATKKYLPKYNLEDEEDYKDRVASTPFVNVYEDVVSSLCAKPFSREVQFEDPDDVDQAYKDLYEDIDGQGNNMHVFAERTFRDGVDCAMDWVLVDYTKLPELPEGRTARSLAEEQALGARPYWVHVPAASVIAAYSTMVRGKEVLTHARLLEPTLVRDGYGETVETRVREYNREPITAEDGQEDYAPATWVLQRKVKNQNGQETWELVEQGTVAIEIIPLVPFIVGKRMGNGWAARAPLSNLLDMQIDAFQQESNLRNIEVMACFPMLTANGVQQPTDQPVMPGGKPTPVKVRTGPRAVLWAPPPPGGTGTPGSWAFIEPSATSLTYLEGRLDGTYERMREIGMQPLAESPQTVITSANVSVKANSALQAWALRLKDTLEQCLVVTTLWLGGDPALSPGADVYTDFGVDVQGAAELDTLSKANSQKALSNQTYREELKRRNVLSGNFNEADEEQRLAEEAAASADAEPGDGSEGDIDPATGEPLEAANDGGEPADPAAFADAGDIDDATLERLFGTTGE